ncbi:MAG: LolA family protein [Verrucomicrobiales bacterium]
MIPHFRSAVRALFAIAAMAPLPALADAAAGDAVIRRWIDGQKDVQSLTITFRQERELKGLKKPVVATGQIWLDRQNRMRWQIGDPPKTIAVYREKEVKVIHQDKKLVERRVIGEKGDNQGEMEKAFLESGIPDSLEDFQKFFRILGTSAEGGLDRVNLEVKDSRAQTALTAMDFLIDRNSNLLAGYDVSFRDGSSIRTRFIQVKKNSAFTDDLFAPDTSGYTLKELEQ